MPCRRYVLRMAGSALVATAGCVGDAGETPRAADPPTTSRPTQSPTPTASEPTPNDTTSDDLPDWTPEWTEAFGDWGVLGLTTAHDRLYTVLQSTLDGGASAVAAVDPAEGEVLWRTDSAGQPVGGSHAGYYHIARSHHGVTTSAEAVYTVAGRVDEYEWTAVHALERESGDRLWSVERAREFAVAGIVAGLVVVTGLEFFEPKSSHNYPEESLTTVVYGIDATSGDVRWREQFAGVQDVTTNSGGVYVAAGDRLVGLDTDGNRVFTYDRGPSTWVEADVERIYYLTGDDETARLHGLAPNGDVDWTRALPVHELLLTGDRCYAGGDAVAGVKPDGTVAWKDGNNGQWLLTDPSGETLYSRAGPALDRATAYATDGTTRWTFNPPSTNAWPAAATNDALAVTAITAEEGPFKTVYSVDDDGEARKSLARDTVFDAAGLDGRIYLADGRSELLALEP